MGRQRQFEFHTWGGRRAGSGRKPAGKTAGVAHAPRPVFARTLPVHVTFRIRKGVWNLRGKAYRTVERAIGDGANRFGARILRFSVQGNHIHMLIEADDRDALMRSCRGLSIRIAKRLNKLMGRSGRVLGDRYHTRVLRTPTEVKRAIEYIRDNYKKHYHPDAKYAFIDPCSSDSPDLRIVLPTATSWLARTGWHRGKPPSGAGAEPQ